MQSFPFHLKRCSIFCECFGDIKTSLFLSPQSIALIFCSHSEFPVGRIPDTWGDHAGPSHLVAVVGSFFSTPSEKLERRGGRRGLGGQRGRGRIWRRMEQTLSRGVLLQIEEEDGHGEDQASGGDPLEGSDLAAVRRILEREASKQEQHWRSVHMQLNQLKEDVEADRRSSPAPDPAPAPALAPAPATAPVAPVTWPRAAIPRLEEDDDI